MKPGRTSHVRSVLLAAIAAFCLVTFGALPHAGAVAASAGPAAAQSAPAAAAVAQHDSEQAARIGPAFGAVLHLAQPDGELAAAGVVLAAAVLLGLSALSRPRRHPRFSLGSGPARAPPLCV